MKAKRMLGVVLVALAAAPNAAAAEFAAPAIVTGAGQGGGPHVRGFDARGRPLPVSFHGFSGNSGGVRVATADVDGDGRPEIVAAPGASGSEVKVFDGRTYALRHRFLPYWAWGSGVYVAAGDLDGDRRAEVVAATGPGCCTSARFFSVSPSRELVGFFLYEHTAEVGARVALADFTGDGRAELAAVPLRGSASGRVRLYAMSGGGTPFRSLEAFRGEASAALAAGDVTGDARAEVVAAALGQVKVLDVATGRTLISLVPYPAAPERELAVAVGDVNGDGRADVVTAAPTLEGLSVRAFDAAGRLLASFFALDSDLRGSPSLAAADLDGDGLAEIVLGTGPTMGEPRVAVFDGVGRPRGAFSYDEPFFAGGVRVALGNVLGGARPEIVAAPGLGRPAEIRLYDPEYDFDGNLLRSFFPYGAAFTGGLYVAAADTQGDRHAEIVVGPGAGAEPRVKVLDGEGRELASFLAFEPEFRGGVRVSAGDLDADGQAEIVAATASGQPRVRTFGADGAPRLTSVPFDGDAGAEVAVADLAGDGRAELLIADPSNARVRVEDGRTGRLVDELFDIDAGSRLAALDVDGDGRDEILAGSTTNVSLFRGNRRIGGFAPYPWAAVDVFLATAVPVGPALAIDRRSLRAVVGTLVRSPVAVFHDAAGRTSAAEFRATIDWGDDDLRLARGVVSPRGGGRFAVTGGRRYLYAGTFRIAVTVTDARGRAVRTTSTVRVESAPLRTRAVAATAGAGVRSRLVLGHVRDLDVTATAEQFRVEVMWGDGSRSRGQIVDRGQAFELAGVHRYRRAGTYPVVVRVVERAGPRRAIVRTIVRVRR